MKILKKKGMAFAVSAMMAMSVLGGAALVGAADGTVIATQDFESATQDIFGYGNGSIVSTDAHTGSKCVKLPANWQNFGDQGAFFGQLSLEPNTDYILSYWAKGQLYLFNMLTPDTSSADKQFKADTIATYDVWTEVKVPFKTGSSIKLVAGIDGKAVERGNTIEFQIQSGFAVGVNGGADLYLDDFSVIKADVTTPTTPTPTAAITSTATPTVSVTPTATGSTSTPTAADTFGATPTGIVTTTPTPTAVPPTVPPVWVNKTAYVPVSKVAIAKVSGKVTVSSKNTVVYKKASAKGKTIATIKKGKKITVKSVNGQYAKVLVNKKYGYVKVNTLKFAAKQSGKIIAKTYAYEKANEKSKKLKTFAKKAAITLNSRYNNYYKVTVKVKK